MAAGIRAGKRRSRVTRWKMARRRPVIESSKVGYDVIIAGGSFAGLAVASQIHGRTLFIEYREAGGHESSACIERSVAWSESVISAEAKYYRNQRRGV